MGFHLLKHVPCVFTLSPPPVKNTLVIIKLLSHFGLANTFQALSTHLSGELYFLELNK